MKAALPVTFVASLMLAACVPAGEAPAPAPAPIARPAPRPAPATPPPVYQAPVSDSWMDAPATPGTWRYEVNGEGSRALFLANGTGGVVSLSCEAQSGNIALLRFGTARGPQAITVRSETATRTLSAQQTGSPNPYLVATLTASDPLLDAVALSKGRFAVEVEGLAPLYLPSWAEVSRVIEDCR